MRKLSPKSRRSPIGGRFLFALPLLFAACSDSAKPATTLELEGLAMGTTYSIRFVARTADNTDRAIERQKAQDLVSAALKRVNSLFSTYHPDSMISRFNAHRSTEPFGVDAEFAILVKQSLELAEYSAGAFDPTILPLMTARGFGPKAEPVDETKQESASAIRAREAAVVTALGLVDFRKLQVSDGPSLRKADPAVEIDLNAIAKGYGVDVVTEALRRAGYEAAMVEIGGEVRCYGIKPNGKVWAIGIETPDSDNKSRVARLIVPLEDKALATSGSYRQFHESSGGKLHHILDPRTGANRPGAAVSVSVRAATCARADALATCLMILGPDGAEGLLASYPGEEIGVLFLLRDKAGLVSEKRIAW